MKGLLLKDFYIVRSLLLYLAVVFLVLGISMSYLVTPWVLPVIATIMLGMNVPGTINMDKSSGWLKTVMTLPVSRRMYLSSKYVMYLLTSLAGFLLGGALAIVAAQVTGKGVEDSAIFICISLTMALMSGSVLMPCYFLLGEEKSILGTVLAYPASAGVFVLLNLIFGKACYVPAVSVAVGAVMYGISWYVSGRILSGKDV